MKLKEIMELDKGVSGLTVNAKLLNSFAPKTFEGKYGNFEKQTITLTDGDEGSKTVFARIGSGFVSMKDIGKDIEITDCYIDEYKGEKKIETSKNSKVNMVRTESKTEDVSAKAETVKHKEDIVPPTTLAKMVDEALDEVNVILNNTKLSEVVTRGGLIGLSSEDIRAMLISRMIEKSRRM